ncbi:MAG: DUF5009 domain-containing protein [Alistipes sp.]|nr:DUF5009 domain-containing protein [Alistipes sp.]
MTNSTSSTPQFKAGRLESLDILRGFDLFMLLMFQPVFMALSGVMDVEWLEPVRYQLEHEPWDASFRLWDMVMPLFLFMSGASIPFAMNKYLTGERPRSEAYLRIAKRVILLYVLGGIVQGNFLGFDPNRIYLYSNTLQTIAVGYLVTSLLVLNCSLKWQVVAAVALLVIYWIPMTFCGDFTPDGNFAEKVDSMILGRFRDGTRLGENGEWVHSPYYHYTWIWSSLNFSVTVLLGSFAGQITRRVERAKAWKMLLGVGVALLVCGKLWDPQMPINKQIWSSSMTLWAGGWSFIALAVFYYIIDYKGYKRGLEWLKYYGMNSIVAYMLANAVNVRSVVDSVSYGLKPLLGDYYNVWLTFGNFFIVFLILRILYKQQKFIRV